MLVLHPNRRAPVFFPLFFSPLNLSHRETHTHNHNVIRERRTATSITGCVVFSKIAELSKSHKTLYKGTFSSPRSLVSGPHSLHSGGKPHERWEHNKALHCVQFTAHTHTHTVSGKRGGKNEPSAQSAQKNFSHQ